MPLLDAAEQGLRPDYTIADAGQDLRAGQRAAWGDTPCHGDVFHIQRQCEGLANTPARLAKGATSRRQTLQAKMGRAGQRGPDHELAARLALARRSETQAHELARDIRALTGWLRHDVLVLAGPALATRQLLFDFLVEELARREPGDARRIRLVRVALQNQRDTLLAFAGVLDAKLADVARALAIAEPLVREARLLHRSPTISPAYWQGWNRLRAQTGGKFHTLFAAVSRAMADTPRSSALVEDLNSRLRPYFTLRRHLGGSYLSLLRFFLNHRCFTRSRCAERHGKSPRELVTGQAIRTGWPRWAWDRFSPSALDAGRLAASRIRPTLPAAIRPSRAGGLRAPRVTQKGQILNRPSPGPWNFSPVLSTIRCLPPAPGLDCGRGTSRPSARRHKVVWSGMARSRPSRPMMEPTSLSVCRNARRNTARRHSPVRIARAGVVRLPAGCGPAFGAASRNRVLAEPHRQAAALAQARVIRRPVRHPPCLLGNVVAADSFGFEWHRGSTRR